MIRPYAALARAGFRRWSTYRQAAVAGIVTNTVFGFIKLSILLATADAAGGTVAGYGPAALSTYTWTSQALIAVVMLFGWTELADRVRSGDIATDLARPVDLQLAWLASDLGRAGWGLVSRAVVPMLVGAAAYGLFVPDDLTAVALFPLALLLAVVVSFAGLFIVNLLAVWTTDIRGPLVFYVLVSGLLGGHIIPIPLFPDWLRLLAYATPFPALVQWPTDLVTGQATGLGVVWRVAAQCAWAAGLLLAGRWLLRRATRSLVVHGG